MSTGRPNCFRSRRAEAKRRESRIDSNSRRRRFMRQRRRFSGSIFEGSSCSSDSAFPSPLPPPPRGEGDWAAARWYTLEGVMGGGGVFVEQAWLAVVGGGGGGGSGG